MKNQQKNTAINLKKELGQEDNHKTLFKIQVSSHQIDLDYFRIYKYCQTIQEECTICNFVDIINEKVRYIQETTHVNDDNIILFFKLISEENIEICNENYSDLCQLSAYFKVPSLQKYLTKYAHIHSEDIDFIIYQILENLELDSEEFYSDKNIVELEKCLSNKINECFQNKKFNKLPINVIYQILKDYPSGHIDDNLLYEFIMMKKEERYVLLSFINLQNLSNHHFNDLYENYIKEQNTEQSFYYGYFPNSLTFIKQLKDNQKILQNRIKKLEESNQKLKDKFNDIEEENIILKKTIKKLEINKNEEKIDVSKIYVDEIDVDKIDDDEIEEENNEIETDEEESDENYENRPITNDIIKYLNKKSRILDEIQITTSSKIEGSKENLLFQNGKIFTILNFNEQWICYKFIKHKVFVSGYSFYKAYHCAAQPRSWIVEGSNDNVAWIEIDKQVDCVRMQKFDPVYYNPDKDSIVPYHEYFVCQNEKLGPFKFIRITQTDLNWANSNLFTFLYIDFNGKIV